MEYAQKYRWALGGVIILLVLNIVTLVTIWMIRPTGGSADDPRRRIQRFLQHELDLSTEQTDAFQQLRSEHIRQTRAMVSDLQESRRTYIEFLKHPESPEMRVKRDSLANRIGVIHARLEETAYNHFREMRNLLDEKQRQKFDSVIEQSLHWRGTNRRQSGRRRGTGPGGMF